jgi:dihydrofolate reductase
MSRLTYSTSMSLDGFSAGPDQSPENPLGNNGRLLHEWMAELAVWRQAHGLEGGATNASSEVFEASDANVGAIVMGRNMFGGGPGPWGAEAWRGWWGEDPPFHLPVFVITHHAREPLQMEGGTSFTFVTGGIEEALALARQAAGGKNVAVSGGAGVAKQYLAAGLLDELTVHLVPVLLGAGVRLFEPSGQPPARFEQVRAIEAPGVTHLTYRVVS